MDLQGRDKGETIMAKQNPTPRAVAAAAALVTAIILSPAGAAAQEAKEGLLGPWAATAEVSYVVTGGNSSTSALSIGTSLSRKWTNDSLLFKTYILNSRSRTTTRTAQGTEEDFDIIEDIVTRKVAENYILSGQYDRRVSGRLVVQGGASWDRNRFAGVDDRVMLSAGFGYSWIENPRTIVKSSAGMTYTLRQYVGQGTESFAGFRITTSGDRKLSKSSSVASVFVFDDNLKRMTDWRFDWTNSLSASINKSMALKLGLRTLYAHLPANQSLPLIDLLGEPTGLFVPYPLRHLDLFLTTSIVVNF
jgi:putative salt-induced outer membrane protein YdiY